MRKPSEVIHIGADVRVVVTKVRGNCVYIGIDAPKSTTILRGEVKERIDRGEDAKLPPKGERQKVAAEEQTVVVVEAPLKPTTFGKALNTALTTIQGEVESLASKA
jgi:carbon storage regulator CsrA